MPIGFFDSGLGGLTVLEKALRMMPDEDYVYYADEANLPYGEKTPEQIAQFARTAVECLRSRGCKAVVIACNTATSVAVEDLRRSFSLPIVGIEPAVKPAVEQTGHRRILVMATPVTIRESRLKGLIAALDAEDSVDLLAMPELVRFCEREEYDSPAVREYIRSRLQDKDPSAYSALVLGCTHFNHFRSVLGDFFPEPVRIIDGSLGTARRLQALLEERGVRGGGTGRVEYVVTGGEPAPEELVGRAGRLLDRLKRME
ncbi:MAG: glutamate racemase [Oscillospiraceae bacterium]|nr:glutamate racemase [Oscillospiraceae bacterium]